MSEWFCEILGEQLGPMPWSELVYLAERGNLRANHRVRQGAHGDWRQASEVAGLPVPDVEQAPVDGHLAEEQDAFEIGPGEREGLFPQLIAAPAANGWVASSREEDPSLAPLSEGDFGGDLSADRRPTTPESDIAVSSVDDAPLTTIGLAEPSPPALSIPSTTARRPAGEPPAPRRTGPRRDSIAAPRLIKPLMIVTAVAAVAVAGWFGLDKSFADGRPYRDVLRGYELRYQELTGVRQTRPDARSSRVFAARFKIGVASLRQRLTAIASDPIGDNLRSAGSLLDAMSATAFSAAGSEDEAMYLQQERQLHEMFTSAKTSLGVTTQ